MTQEEKANAYDEALEKAKNEYQTHKSFNGFCEMLAHIFPELAESKDEKIRKEIINYFKCQSREEPSRKDTHNKWIAWLEKIIIPSHNDIDSSFIEDIKNVIAEAPLLMQSDKKKMIAWLEKQGTSYTKRDVDDAYIKGMSDAKRELEKQGEKKCIDDLTQQEAMDIAVAKCFEQGGQKPTWSEEDEVRLQACIDTLQAKSIMGKVDTIQTNWLRSLKQRYTWKPSKEQMDAMQMAVSYFDYSWVSKEQKLLESLYKDLKKLTEG